MFPSFLHTYTIIQLQDTDSTNNYTATLEKRSNVQHKTVILASFQTKGKGQHQNTWNSEPGKNLLLSIYIKPKKLAIDRQFELSRIAALAIRDCVSYFLKKPVSIKWPNDIFLDSAKIAGILIENNLGQGTIDRSIIGIGVNVNQQDFESLNATSFLNISNKEWDHPRVLEYLLYRFDEYLEMLNNASNLIHKQYDFNLYKRNQWMQMESPQFGNFKGRITGTLANGMLMVEDSNGKTHHFNHKEVSFSSIPSPND
jgi:BirA family biotin operon repressor/biotin-[acetyl-CoA-carboxylase] ligase